MKKTVLVTGYSSKISKEICKLFMVNGFNVFATSSKSTGKINGINILKMDLTVPKSIKDALSFIDKKAGSLDIVVNVSGISLEKSLLKTTNDDFEKVFNVNTRGLYYLLRFSYPLLSKSSGKFVSITSLNSFLPWPRYSVYSASKHAQSALLESAGYEFNPDVEVCDVVLGAVAGGKQVKHKSLREKSMLFRLIFPMVSRQNVAESIVSLSLKSKFPRKIFIGRDTWLVFSVKRFIPYFLWNYLVKKISK